MTELLKEGHIIRLEKGMRVYTYVPEFAISGTNILSLTPQRYVITIGQQLSNPSLTREDIIKQIERHPYFYLGDNISYNDINDYVNSLNFDFDKRAYDTSIFEGKYEVGNCLYDGASVVDINTKGWHVHCSKLSNPEIKTDFYQTGFFSAMNPYIQPIGYNPPNYIAE